LAKARARSIRIRSDWEQVLENMRLSFAKPELLYDVERAAAIRIAAARAVPVLGTGNLNE